jgi:hypothetical protein
MSVLPALTDKVWVQTSVTATLPVNECPRPAREQSPFAALFEETTAIGDP